jgi:hypothetical protein
VRRVGAWALGRMLGEGRGAVRLATLLAFAVVLVQPPTRLSAQASVHAQAIPLVTRASHTPGDKTLTEFALSQPAVMLEWRRSRFSVRATLDAEGLTIPGGELSPGSHGEGYYDRRHPHTYVHELMALGVDLLGARDGELRVSIAAGPKGFVAFGTDDPMGRPVARYPINHHLAQILERSVVIGSLSYRGLSIERSWFNGDEPTRPDDWPEWHRGLDSDAWRFTIEPRPGLSAQFSLATVQSPEHEPGAGQTQEKNSFAIRYDRKGPNALYLLGELAHTEDAQGFFVYNSQLVEGALSVGRHRPYARFERTDRGEEERALDPFRSQRPHFHDGNIGTTRWTVWTAGYGVSFLTAKGRLEWRPFVEGSVASAKRLEGIFDPEDWYGSDVLPSVTLGVRLDWGGMGKMRMGRYFDVQDDHALMRH